MPGVLMDRSDMYMSDRSRLNFYTPTLRVLMSHYNFVLPSYRMPQCNYYFANSNNYRVSLLISRHWIVIYR